MIKFSYILLIEGNLSLSFLIVLYTFTNATREFSHANAGKSCSVLSLQGEFYTVLVM